MSGDVVWNPVTQQGFLRFVGLRPNDPQMHQYQLWIFDAARDQRYPVDGGVFDVPANQGEVVVPIRAALPVGSAKAFAVTIEKPGGVVVSGRRAHRGTRSGELGARHTAPSAQCPPQAMASLRSFGDGGVH